MRDRLAAETDEEREVRLQQMRDRWQLRPTKRERSGYSRWETGWQLRPTKSEMPGYSRWVIISVTGWQLRLLSRDRPDYIIDHSVHCLSSLVCKPRLRSTRYEITQHSLRLAPTMFNIFLVGASLSEPHTSDTTYFRSVRLCMYV